MIIKDASDHEFSGASARSLERFDQAAHQLRCFIGDPVATVQAALDESPEMVMGHVLNAYLHLLGTEPDGLPVARASLALAHALPANDRERRHVDAVASLVDGRWRAAARTLEDLSIEYPRDALALQAGHQLDFFTGDSRMLRDRIARALPHWTPSLPGYHAVLGMHAFGLEETGDYRRAEAAGRRCVELEPRDAWGQHAVAHVMEMQGRRRDGIEWMTAAPRAWSEDNFLSVHNWWHTALFHLGIDQVDEVLALYDGPIRGGESGLVLDMIDASAMLWRLQLRGVDVGDRWDALADRWGAVAATRNYAFNDMHAAMAFVGAGRTGAVRDVLATQVDAMRRADDNADFTREVGHAATKAIAAFGDGDFAETVRLLRPIRSYAHRFGGSHAQRDVIDLTLIEAASRAKLDSLAAALRAERSFARPEPVTTRRDPVMEPAV
jgi:hypothetical protein